MGGNAERRAGSARRVVIVGWSAGLLLAAVVLSLASVGVAGLATGTGVPQGWEQWGEAFSVVNGVFSVLALAVVGITLWVQYNELRLQRAELRLQREATEQSHRELHRSVEANVRDLHLQLIDRAIGDPDLAAVWVEYAPGLSDTRRKQFLYANLMLAHFNMLRKVMEPDDNYLGQILADAFESPIMRDFWATVRGDRRRIRPPGTPDATFDDLCEAAYQKALRQSG